MRLCPAARQAHAEHALHSCTGHPQSQLILSCTLMWGLQVLRAINRLLGYPDRNSEFQRLIFCENPQLFHERLLAHIDTMAPHGFTAAALGVLAARDVRVLLREPDWLAVQFEMLRAFFAPYGDALIAVPPRSTITRACLPAVVAGVKRGADPGSGVARHAALSCVHRVMLSGPDDVLVWTRDGLRQHMRTLVATGLFDVAAEARRECMLRPQLLRGHQLQWHLERKAAVLLAGGSMSDALEVCCHGGAFSAALPCLLLRQHSGCVPATESRQVLCSPSERPGCTGGMQYPLADHTASVAAW